MVLPRLINNDQTVYLKNRYIGENIRLLQDFFFFTEQTNKCLLLNHRCEIRYGWVNQYCEVNPSP